MTLDALNEVLCATGLPVAYDHFAVPTPLPHIAYLETGSHNMAADGLVYYSARRIRVELYTDRKDPQTEALVESALSGFVWEKDSSWVKSEECYLTNYEFEV